MNFCAEKGKGALMNDKKLELQTAIQLNSHIWHRNTHRKKDHSCLY